MMRRFRRWLIRLGFDLLYNELAITYDWVSTATSVGQWRTWQRTALSRLTSGPRVLELAHGTGDTLIDLVGRGFQPVGIDLSQHMGLIAGRKLARHRIDVPLVRGRAQALPFASRSFPSIVATFPTEYIVDPNALAEFSRVLQDPDPAVGKPGGRLIFIPSAVITGGGLLHRLAAGLFSATGQSGNWPPQVEARYQAAGFKTRIEVQKLKYSQVTIVVAEKVSA